MTTTTFTVTGMHCDHCVTAVTDEIRRLDGVQDVTTELDPAGPSRVTVSSGNALAEEQLRAAVEEAGYTFTGIAP